MQLINVGFGNIVVASRIVAIVSPESAPIKRIIQDAKENKSVIDATYGRKTRSSISYGFRTYYIICRSTEKQ